MRLRSDAKGIDIDRRVEESHEQTSPKVTSPKMGLPRSCKRKRGKQTPHASSQCGDLTQLAGRFGSVNVSEEMEETYAQLSEQAQSHVLHNVSRQSDFSTVFNIDPGQFIRGLPMLRMRLEGHFLGEQMFRTRKRIDLTHFYNAYMVAQNNPDAFLKHTAKEMFGNDGCIVARRTSRKSSMVKQRFVDILFSGSPFCKHESAVSGTCRGTANKQKVRELFNQKVEDWRRSGKPWSEMISRFDYGILLLVPSELTDER
jgi:hypothetical protein